MNKNKKMWILGVVLILLAAALFLGKGIQKGGGEQTGPSSGSSPESSSEGFDYIRALADRNQTFDPADAEIKEEKSAVFGDKKDYTVLVYMVGSNLESRMGNATADMDEMLSSGLDFKKTNLVIYTGGSRRWATNVPADRNCVLDLSKDEDQRIVASTEGNADMGAPETLSAFLNFAKEHYPSDHYSLVLWDHGGGPLWGFGSDELFNSDSIMLTELKKALKEGPFHKKDKLDWVGFDACLMGSFESMSIWKDYADYYVGSEEVEPGEGWDYSFLKILNETTDPKKVTSEILHSYKAYYEAQETDTYKPDITLSVADLSRVGQLDHAMGNLFKSMGSKMDESQIRYRKYRQESKDFGLVENEKGGDPFSYDLVDLGSLCTNFKNDFAKECQDIEAELDQLIVDQVSNVDESSGVTLYYPVNNRNQFRSMRDSYMNINENSRYQSILSDIMDQWGDSKRKEWTLPEPEKKGEEYIISLTPDQKENVVSASYTILKKNDDGSYNSILRDCKAEIDGQGTIHIPADPELICVAGKGKGDLWSAIQVENTKARNVYRSDFAHFNSGDVNAELEYGYESEMQEITVLFAEDKETGNYQILSIEGDNGGLDFNGKNQVKVEDWITVGQSRKKYFPVKETSGEVLPFREWDTSAYLLFTWCLEDQFSFEGQKMSSLEDDFILQVEIEDASGHYYGSPLTLIAGEKTYQEKKVKTDQGQLLYHLWKDHGEIISYQGTDPKLVLPDQVDGVPITKVENSAFAQLDQAVESIILPDSVEEISGSAFSGAYYLKEIHLPDQLKRVGDKAFWGCACLKSLDWPAGVEEWGNLAITFCDALTEVTLPDNLKKSGYGNYTHCKKLKEIKGNCPAYTQKGNVLFSKDGKILMAYPAGSPETAYDIPGGTEEIAYNAFAGARNLENVTFPEGLLKIGNNSFSGCDRMTGLDLPDSLVEIGAHSFDEESSFEQIHLTVKPAKIHIGKNLVKMGKNTFSIFSSRYFEVSAENDRFQEKDGALMNKAGDTALQSKVDEYYIYLPEGSLELDSWDTVNSYKKKYLTLSMERQGKEVDVYQVLEIVIPPSVRSIADVKGLDQEPDKILIHCEKGSYAETYAMEYDLPYDYNMKPKWEEYVEEGDQGNLHYALYPDHAALIKIEGKANEILIPDKVKNLQVTVIGDGKDGLEAYRLALDYSDPEHTSPVTSLKLPDTVKEIRAHALEDSQSLTELTLPEGLEEIGDYGLPYNLLLDRIPDGIKVLGEGFGNVNLTEGSLALPASLERISPKAFDMFFTKPETFTISDQNKNYAVVDGALYSKDKKTLILSPYGIQGEYRVPEGTTGIGDYAFQAREITAITLPSSLENWGMGICSSCTMLTSVTLEKGIKEVGPSAFESCEILEKVVLPDSLKKIERFAFAYCPALKKMDFPEGMTSIGTHAFFNDPQFSEFTLPSSMTNLGYGAFQDGTAYDDEGMPTTIPLRGEEMETLKIGKDLLVIDEKSIDFLNFKAFQVDSENTAFSEREGCLFDRRGTVLYRFPSAAKGKVTVPEGTVGLKLAWSNGETERITDLVIPDSVEYIDDIYSYDGFENVTFHCSKDSAVYRYAVRNNIKCITK